MEKMKALDEIDRNFAIKSEIKKEDLRFYDIEQDPFKIYGVFKENGQYRRLPEAVAGRVSSGVAALHLNTAGGRVRFKTNSPYIAIHAEMNHIGKMPHFTLAGSAGFDLYINGEESRYAGTFMPPFQIDGGYESMIDFDAVKMREITINFPLYSGVCALYIGLADGSAVEEPAPYTCEKPVVYYGSSITQGGCASRPGNSYQAVIARRLNCNYINLGFSGSAKGEKEIAEYIAQLDMSVFVYDYDHNAPDAAFLEATHRPMFEQIRMRQPELPVIMLTRPNHVPGRQTDERIRIVYNTYETAVQAGDQNVYFINGQEIFHYRDPDMMTVDGTHPNDFGFWCMAELIGARLEKILNP